MESDQPVEVTIVDNGGLTDDFRDVRILRQPINRGYAGGANVAVRDWLRRSNDEFCLIGSHDLHVERSTLTQLIARARHDPKAGIVAPNLGSSGARGRRLDEDRYEWASGTGMLLRRQCIEQVGLFDELLGSYCEDVELGYYARAAGWEVVIVKDAQAHGLGSAHPRARVLRLANQPLTVANRHGGRAGLRTLIAQPVIVARDLVRALTHPRERARRAQAARDRLVALPRATAKLIRWFRRRSAERGNRTSLASDLDRRDDCKEP
jgi:hypothetical protein